MRFKLLILLAIAAVLAACTGQPPTVIYVVLSPTPEGQASSVTAEVTAEPTVIAQVAATATAAPAATSGTSAAVTETPLPPNFPTPVRAQIQYAEQLFEHGRMFWLQPIGQIWVLVVDGEGRGTWSTYADTWVEGEPETDPSLVAPADGLEQPVRGFGKLWRSNADVQQALGWAVQPEYGYVADYEYLAGGSIDAQGNYQRAGGHHVIYSLYGERFTLSEADGTWVLGG